RPLIIEPRTAVRRTTKDSQLSLRPLVGAREGALEREPKNLGPDAGRFVQRALFHVRQNGGAPAPTLVQVFSGVGGREDFPGAVIVMNAQANLLEIVLTLDTCGSRTYLLHRRDEQGNKDGNDRNDDQQLNEREARPCGWFHRDLQKRA